MGKTAIPGMTLYEYILSEVISHHNQECWLWKYNQHEFGYGTVYVQGYKSHRKAHVVAYEARYGPVPVGMELDHFMCRTPSCWNPEHVQPVTHIINVQRGRAGENTRLKTHCPKGHEYNEANTYHYKGSRFCRACNKIFKARSHE